MIVSILDKTSGGFFSQFFFTMNHYLSAKYNNIPFHLESNDWLFKYKKDWTDYFENIDLHPDPDLIPQHIKGQTIVMRHSSTGSDFPLIFYRLIVPEIYRYNENTRTKIMSKMGEFNLIGRSYDSIFIRRGDKLGWESKYIPTEKYLDVLLKRNPWCKCIFVQTDDYNSVSDLEKLVEERGLEIEIKTLCHEDQRGVIVFQHNIRDGLEPTFADSSRMNHEYLHEIMPTLRNTKPVNLMTPTEIYEHTMTMIIGIDIVLQSGICVCDFQSNVSRFIKLAHPNMENVIDVVRPDDSLDMNVVICPSYGFSKEEEEAVMEK
jgi:hypothetical protein